MSNFQPFFIFSLLFHLHSSFHSSVLLLSNYSILLSSQQSIFHGNPPFLSKFLFFFIGIACPTRTSLEPNLLCTVPQIRIYRVDVEHKNLRARNYTFVYSTSFIQENLWNILFIKSIKITQSSLASFSFVLPFFS